MNDRTAPRAEAYDLAVVGAGSAGFAAAIAAAEAGARVLLAGHGTIGGTCVNIGCVPSKTLIRAAEALHGTRAAARFAGIAARARLEDWPALVQQKADLVAGLRQAKYADLLPRYPNITYVTAQARLAADGIALDGAAVRARRVVITTGARPALPAIPGIESVPVLTSTEALSLDRLPASLLVVGAGFIGCELAQMFARFGVAVTLVCRSRVLPGAEPEIGGALAGYLGDEGVTVHEGLAYERLETTADGVRLSAAKGGAPLILEAEAVLAASGRQPNTEALALEDAGVTVDRRGAVVVDAHMRTSREGVYAAGDVAGRDQFVYMAAYGAKIAALNALEGDRLRYDATAMPAIVFTDPQVAQAGLTEAEARAEGHPVTTSMLALDQVPRALAARDTRGLVKLVAGAEGRLLGAHILAPEGADSIQTAVLAIRHGMTVEDLAATVFPYLTTVEALKLAALTFGKDVTKLSCCAA